MAAGAPQRESSQQHTRPPRQQQRDGGRGAGGGGGWGRGKSAASRPAPPLQHRRQAPARADYFYAESATSFEQLGLSPVVSAALRLAGYPRPSRVQELAIPPLTSGVDVVLAAETGSGKTFAYLAPLAAALLRHRELHELPPADADEDGDGTDGRGPGARREAAVSAAMAAAAAEARRPLALVLVPNAALCRQVVASADALRGADGRPLLRACTVSSRSPPPFDRPDLVVTTPGALRTLLRDTGAGYGWLWTPEGLSEAVRHVVVDEADLLLTGGYERDLKAILELLKVSERRQIEEEAAKQLRVSPEQLRGLSRPLKLALWDGGAKGLASAGWRRAGAARRADADEHDGDGGSGTGGGEKGPVSSVRKQYVFVAATMPSVTGDDVGGELQRRYKAAKWIAGDLLHRSKPRVQHEWVEVAGDEEWAGALVRAVTGCADYAEGAARVLMFAKDVGSANAVSELLRQEGVRHHVYHKAVTQEERDAALQALAGAAAADATDGAAGGGGGNVVVVSTDAAARGIDLPSVTHVVQADFATNAVDFIHRIGRTARADKGGRVTSLVAPAAAPLAAALRAYVEHGGPLEGAFSRNRSFNRKMKRYGEFVPRGEVGPAGGGGGSGGDGAEVAAARRKGRESR